MVKALWQASDYAAQACGDVGGKADKRLSSNVDHRALDGVFTYVAQGHPFAGRMLSGSRCKRPQLSG